MNKGIIVSLAILATGFILLSADRAFETKGTAFAHHALLRYLPLLTVTSGKIPASDQSLMKEAWTTFQDYLAFARNHDLAGIRSLSYQISATCNDSSKEKECFALMDSVYAFASPFKLSQFTHVQMDERQMIMFTDGPQVAILYFIRDRNGAFKVLGLRFCLEDQTASNKCVATDSIKHDENDNGWWDSVESLFYK